MNSFYYTNATELRKWKKQQIGKRHDEQTIVKQPQNSQSKLEHKKAEQYETKEREKERH